MYGSMMGSPCPLGMMYHAPSGRCIPASAGSASAGLVPTPSPRPFPPAPNPTPGSGGHYVPGLCPAGTHLGSAGHCVPNTPAPNPTARCAPGSVFSPQLGKCVPFFNPSACSPGTTYDRVTGSCVPVGAPVCDFTSPFVCSADQWSQLRDVSQAQFLGATAQPGTCSAGVAWGPSNLYW
jgi:hypothetical protein